MMGGGGQSAGGSGSGGTVFIPPNQAGAAGALGDVIQPLLGLSGNAGAGTPGGVNYPLAQSQVYGDLLNPDFQNQAISGAQNAQGIAFNQAVPQALSGGNELFNYASGGLPWSSQALSQGFDPAYQGAVSGIQNNPFYGQQLAGAQTAAGMGAQGANALQGLAGQTGGLSSQMAGAVSPLLQSGFDPRSALFNRSQGRLMDQSNAANAAAGIGNTPYGASVTSNAMGNFDIDWQNQQLARQAQATGAAASAAGQSGALANTAGGLYGAAPGLAASTAGLPSNVYTGQIGQELAALDARNKGANQGIAGYGSLLDNARQGFAGANTANLQGAGAQQQFGAAPYNTAGGIAQNSLSGLSNLTNLGNNQFLLPQQEIGNLMQYMGLGQTASQVSGQLGQQGFNQLSQGLGGALSGANTLFNPSSGLLSGAGGLLGGGGGLSGVEAASAAGAFGGGGELAAGGIGDALASAAPLALSA